MSDQILEDLFGVARAAAPAPSAGLMARVLADAYEAQPLPAPAAAAAAVTRPGWRLLLAAMVDGLGGAGAVAGLGTAAAAGLFFGYASPEALDWLAGAVSPSGADIYELLSAADLFLTEG